MNERRKSSASSCRPKNQKKRNGIEVKFNPRVVAGGIFQILGKDFHAFYTTIIDFTIILTELKMYLKFNYLTRQVYIKAGFLIERHWPKEFPQIWENQTITSWNKARYCLRNSPLKLFLKLRETLTDRLWYRQL